MSPTLLAGRRAAGPTLDSSQKSAVRCPWVRAPGQEGKALAPRHLPQPWSFKNAHGGCLTWGSRGLRQLLAAQGPGQCWAPDGHQGAGPGRPCADCSHLSQTSSLPRSLGWTDGRTEGWTDRRTPCLRYQQEVGNTPVARAPPPPSGIRCQESLPIPRRVPADVTSSAGNNRSCLVVSGQLLRRTERRRETETRLPAAAPSSSQTSAQSLSASDCFQEAHLPGAVHGHGARAGRPPLPPPPAPGLAPAERPEGPGSGTCHSKAQMGTRSQDRSPARRGCRAALPWCATHRPLLRVPWASALTPRPRQQRLSRTPPPGTSPQGQAGKALHYVYIFAPANLRLASALATERRPGL